MRQPGPFEVPFNEHVALTGGGDVNILRFGYGEIRLSYEKDGVRFSFPLTTDDLRGLQIAAKAIAIVDELAQYAEDTQS